MDLSTATADAVRIEPYIRRLRSPAVCRRVLSFDDDDVQSECRIKALLAIRAFRAQGTTKPLDEIKWARAAIRNHLVSLIRKATSGARTGINDAKWGSVLTGSTPWPLDDTPQASVETGYLTDERQAQLEGAIRTLRTQLGEDSFRLLKSKSNEPSLRRQGNEKVDAACGRARRILARHALNHMRDLKEEGFMAAVEIETLSAENLARVALANDTEVESLDHGELTTLVADLYTDPATGEQAEMPECFGAEYDPGDATCTESCDFSPECNAVVGGNPDSDVEAVAEVEEQLVQLKGLTPTEEIPATTGDDEVPDEVPEVVEIEQEPVAPPPPVATDDPNIQDADIVEPDPLAADGGVAAMSDDEFEASAQNPERAEPPAAPPPATTPAKKKAKAKAKAAKKDDDVKSDKKAAKPVEDKHTVEVGNVYLANDKRTNRAIQITTKPKGGKVDVVNVAPPPKSKGKATVLGKKASIRVELLGIATSKGFAFVEKRTQVTLDQAVDEAKAKGATTSGRTQTATPNQANTPKVGKKAEPQKKAKPAAKPKAVKKAASTTKAKAAPKKATKKATKKAPRAAVNGTGHVTLSGKTREPEGGYALKEDGTRFTRLPQGSAAFLATLEVGTRVERVWQGYVFEALKTEDGVTVKNADTGANRKRDGKWKVTQVWRANDVKRDDDGHIDRDAKGKIKFATGKSPLKKSKVLDFEGSLNQVTRAILEAYPSDTGTASAWSGARFFAVLPPQLDRGSKRFKPTAYKPKPVYVYQ